MFAIIRNLSFLPANWKVLADSEELISILIHFISRRRAIRRKSVRHSHFVMPKRYFWDESALEKTDPKNPTPKPGEKSEENLVEWLREVEPYYSRFFGEFGLTESSTIATGLTNWKNELLDELAEDSMMIFNNLALEIDLMELENSTSTSLINTFVNLAATRASQNEVPLSSERNAEPVSTYRYIKL